MLIKHCFNYLFKKNKILFNSINIMILITSFVAFSLFIVNANMVAVKDKYHELNQEDFQLLPKLDGIEIGKLAEEHKINLQAATDNILELFTENNISYNDIYKEKIKELEKEYKFESEIQQSKFISSEGINFKIIKNNTRINKPFFLKGGMADHDHEIVIDVNTAELNHKSVGETYEFMGLEYTVSGIASFSGFVNPNMKDSNIEIYRPETSVVLSVNDSRYESLKAKEKVYYSAVWNNDSKEIPSNTVSYMSSASENPELNVLDLKINMNQMIVGVSVTVMLSIVFIMLTMNLFKMIQDNLKTYGILKAMGYRKFELISSFLPIIFLLVIPVIVGLLLAIAARSTVFRVLNNDLVVPFLNTNITLLFSLTVIVIYFITIMTFSLLVIHLFLRKAPIHLIKNTSLDKNNLVKIILLKLTNKKSFIKSLRNKFMLRNLFVLFIIVFSGFAMGVQLFMGLSMSNFPNQMANAFEEQYKYNYNTVFNEDIDLSSVTDVQGYLQQDMKLILNNISEDVSFIALENSTGKHFVSFFDFNTHRNITNQLDKGVIVSKWFVNKYSLKVGDTIEVFDGNENSKIIIAGVNLNLQGSELYTSISFYENLFNKEVKLFSGVYSDIEPLIDSKEINHTLKKVEQTKAIKMSSENYKLISVVMLLIGLLLGGILLSISLSIAISTGEKNILLLKSMGYTNLEVIKISIIGNISPLLLGVAISIPYFAILSKLLFGELSKATTLFLPMQLELINILLVVGLVILFFIIISTFYILKLTKLTAFQKLVSE